MADKRGGAQGRGARRTSVWLQPAKEPRSPQLTRERIVTAAVEILDAHGVGGLTMRGLAEHLGSGVMSLYWHVENKEDVFELALDSVFEYRGAPSDMGPDDWREDIIHMLQDWRASMLRHPWSASLLERPALGPNVLDRLELLSASLSRAGIAAENLNFGVWSLYNHMMGATIVRASLTLSDADRAVSEQRLAQLSDRYPAIQRSGLLMDDDWDGAFRKGLGFLLDGLTAKP